MTIKLLFVNFQACREQRRINFFTTLIPYSCWRLRVENFNRKLIKKIFLHSLSNPNQRFSTIFYIFFFFFVIVLDPITITSIHNNYTAHGYTWQFHFFPLEISHTMLNEFSSFFFLTHNSGNDFLLSFPFLTNIFSLYLVFSDFFLLHSSDIYFFDSFFFNTIQGHHCFGNRTKNNKHSRCLHAWRLNCVHVNTEYGEGYYCEKTRNEGNCER